MALISSSGFKGVIVQIVCVVEIQFESAWALTNRTSGNTCHAKCHAYEASGSKKGDLNVHIFLCMSMETQDTLGRIHFGHWGHFLNKLGYGPQGNATYQISSS